jgi:uncharacterized protein (TIGR00299 family) protein
LLLYLDAGSGLAGDMIVAALLDLGVPEAVIREGLSGLELRGYRCELQRVARSGMVARHFAVTLEEPQPSRDYAAIVPLIEQASTLTAGARAIALDAFARLARAEARIHGTTIEHVHFHEVGAVDSIVDIVAAAIAFDHIGARVACSALPMGRGVGRSAHGLIPLPAPATVLCLADAPTYDAGIAEELVTPTGACLCAAVVRDWTGWPSFRPERVGLGAGTKELSDRPNVLRVVLGTPVVPAARGSAEASPSGLTRSHGRHVVLETNIDDLSPEITAFALERALAAGALDVWTSPIGMKKGRAGQTVSALTTLDRMDEVSRVLLSETSSLGIRHYPVDRLERSRRVVDVETAFGRIQLKVADGDGLPDHVAPEYESCRHAAESHQIPIRRVYDAALQAYSARQPAG